MLLILSLEVKSVNDPNSYKEAMALSDSIMWLVAIKQEMESLPRTKLGLLLKHLEIRKF